MKHGFDFFKTVLKVRLAIIKDPFEILSKDFLTLLLLCSRKYSYYPSNFDVPRITTRADLMTWVLDDLSKCKKSVFVVDSSEIEAEVEYLTKKYYWRKFYKGKDILQKVPFGWTFEGMGNSRVPKYFQSLYETGNHGRLELEMQLQLAKYRLRGSIIHGSMRKDPPQRLGEPILTFFMLCGMLLFFSAVRLIIEMRRVLRWGLTAAGRVLNYKVRINLQRRKLCRKCSIL